MHRFRWIVFDGKKVIVCQVSDGISKAGELVDRVISGDVPVYHAANGAEVQEVKVEDHPAASDIRFTHS